MTGYVGTRFAESFGVITDYVDPELTELIKVHMNTLLKIPRVIQDK